jgi:3-dehydroquinate dehydratase II
MAKLLVLHGPNLNLLGTREPNTYGSMTLEQINKALVNTASGHHLECYQSNAEHEIVNKIHQAGMDGVSGIVLNPAAYTHTSIAIRDAMLATAIPFVEVHLSNIHSREAFRKHSYLSDIANGVISGLGMKSYFYALNYLIEQIESL